MSETESTPEAKPVPKAEPTYILINVTRRQHTRAARVRSKERRFVLRLGGGALIIRRGRSLTVKESVLRMHLGPVKEAVAASRLEVRTGLQGDLVDLDTLQPMATAEVPASPPPNFRPDDINNDRPVPVRPNVSTNVQHNPSPEALGATPSLLKDAPPEEETGGSEELPQLPESQSSEPSPPPAPESTPPVPASESPSSPPPASQESASPEGSAPPPPSPAPVAKKKKTSKKKTGRAK